MTVPCRRTSQRLAPFRRTWARERGGSPDGAGWGRDGADEAPEVWLRNVDLQWGDLRVEWPQRGCWGLLLVVQGCELDLDGRAREPEGASAKRRTAGQAQGYWVQG